MNKQILKVTIQQLFAGNKGLLAMDESTGTCNKRFAAEGIPQTIEMRRKYRELIGTTPGLNAIHTRFKNHLPWIVSFSFVRAIQQLFVSLFIFI